MNREREIQLLLQWRDKSNPVAKEELWQIVLDRIGFAVENISSCWRINKDEVINEAFIIALTKVMSGEFVPDKAASFSTYCLGIAKNVIKRIKSEKRVISLTGIPDEEIEQCTSNPDMASSRRKPANPCDLLIHEELRELLFHAISELPDDYYNPIRSVFCMRIGFSLGTNDFTEQQMTNKEVAKKYGFNRSWAVNKYTKARRILTKKLAPFIDKLYPSPHSQGVKND
jgi:RNA polymerase sigma factor (sigma-70 family)